MVVSAAGAVVVGGQVIYYGERHSGSRLSDQLRALTAGDLTRAATRILASPLTIAAYGAVEALPPYDYIKSLLA